MAASDTTLAGFAALLDDAARRREAVDRIDPDNRLSLPDAYAVQQALIQLRLDRGERRVGVKMGFTSRAKMQQMGVTDLIWGRLTSGMQVEEGTAVSRAAFVHPRVEPVHAARHHALDVHRNRHRLERGRARRAPQLSGDHLDETVLHEAPDDAAA